MSDLRELLQDADYYRNEAEELERQARLKRSEIPQIGRLPSERHLPFAPRPPSSSTKGEG